ncbi:tankyrase-2 [Loa loa]|uniref:Poly [ADP-ribose] polymerase n=1 Tax=Loa loa TaxID=7209 RepID=A0A1I7W239_LOALO|nr:tankyrase-2 [Loa loa]EJD75737.1 tankyrase-2 [Loa loa]
MKSKRAWQQRQFTQVPAPVKCNSYRDRHHEEECLKLFESCKKGDLSVVSELLKPGTVNQPDLNNRHLSPLHYAAGFGRVDCVRALLAAGANISQVDDSGLVPLHNASSFGHIDVVKILLENGADTNVSDHWGFTPLHEAATWGKADVCVLLLQHGASARIENLDGRTPQDVADGDAKAVFTGDYRKDELLEAAKNGDEESLLSCLTPFNVNCHAATGRKSTPLHLACGYNRVKAVKILLEKGADVQAIDIGGLVPLHNASSFGHLEVVSLLLEAGADSQAEDLWNFTPLHESASKGRLEVVRLLAASGADPTRKIGSAKAPIEYITDEDAKKEVLHEYAGYKIYVAAQIGDILMLKNLLANRNPNYMHPCLKETPLHAVAGSTHQRRKVIAEMLLKNGCPTGVLNKDGFSALHIATKMCSYDVMEILINWGVNISELNSCGQTALHIAAEKGDIDLCKRLLNYGLPTDLKDNEQKTAADIAGNIEIRDLISRWGLEKTNAIEKRCKGNKSIKCNKRKGGCKYHPESRNHGSGSGGSALSNKLEAADVHCTVLQREVQKRHPEEEDLLDAARCGDLCTVKRIIESCGTEIINCKDFDGRESTPLHFAAGYNRVEVLKYLLEKGANVEARDTGWLVPLHNACAYGHLVVAELLVKHGANLNAIDKWGYTPLHEAALKGKFDVCKLLLLSGADPKHKGRDGKSPLDVVREGAEDVYNLLRGDEAVLEAAKEGDVEKIRKIVIPATVNCRDVRGRLSTPLHLAAGYNNLEVVQFLLENGAEVNLKDKGGLIPLHNASSFGHLEIAALLIEYGAEVNHPDKWGYTPLHEAAQKGRTQICSLLLNNGADVTLKNNEGVTALDITIMEDTKELLMSAVPVDLKKLPAVHIVDDTSGSVVDLTISSFVREISNNAVDDMQLGMVSCSRNDASLGDKKRECNEYEANFSMEEYLLSIGLSSLSNLFAKEKITLDVLAIMTHDDLKAIGIDAFGTRFRLLKNIGKYIRKSNEDRNSPSNIQVPVSVGTVLVQIERSNEIFQQIEEGLNFTIVSHRDLGLGGTYTKFEVIEIQKIINKRIYERYVRRRGDIAEENCGEHNEKFLYHGSPFIHSIVQKGFDERYSYMGGMFGAGIYFAEHSSKSNQYVFGMAGSGCSLHHDRSCYICARHLLLCRVTLGKCFVQSSCNKMAHSPPGHHSVMGQPRVGGLNYPEYVIYRGEQAYPEYVIVYRIVNDNLGPPF